MRKINFPLLFGALIVLMLVLIVSFPDQIIKIDPNAMDYGNVRGYEDGKLIVTSPPEPPNERNILGTDVMGRDIFSRIIVGAATTLKIALFVTLFRFILALPFAFISGSGGRISTTIIRFFTIAFSAVPALLFSFIILNFTRLKNLELQQSILVFIAVLTIVGWGRLADVLKDRIKDILNQDFIKGEIAIGKSKFLIGTQNVFPHLTPSIIIYGFLEIGRVLLILAALGVFGVYVGVNKIDKATVEMMRLSIYPSYYPEWGGMLSTARYAITSGEVWVALFPACAFFISILGFNLVGEGLKLEVNKRSSRAITLIKKIPFQLSPKTFIYQIKNMTKYKWEVAIKAGIILVLVIIPLIPSPKSQYTLDNQEVFSHIKEISNDKYEGRRVGSEGSNTFGEYIVEELKKAELEPLFDGSYIQEFELGNRIVDVNKIKISVKSKSSVDSIEFKFKENFNISSIIGGNTEGEIVTLEQFQKGEVKNQDRVFVFVNNPNDFYNNPELIDKVARSRPVNGIIVESKYDTQMEKDFSQKLYEDLQTYNFYKNQSSRFFKPFTIYIDKEIGFKLKEHIGNKLIINSQPKHSIVLEGKNIGAVIKGRDNENGEKIILTTNYDYIGYKEGYKYKGLLYNGTTVSALIEIAKKLSSIEEIPNRDIIILFLDSSMYYNEGTKNYVLNPYDNIDGNTLMLHMNSLGSREDSNLYLDTSSVIYSELPIFKYTNYMKRRAEQLKINLLEVEYNKEYEDVGQIAGYKASALVIKGLDKEKDESYSRTCQNGLEIISEEALKNQIQLILDTIVFISYS